MSEEKTPAVKALWQAFLDSLPEGAECPAEYSAWGFGNTPEMADELGALVVEGTKTATASLMFWYEEKNEPMPKVGDYSVILDGRGEPMCITRITRLDQVPYKDVGEEMAYLEGEGDRSLAYWRRVHRDFFTGELSAIGETFSEDMVILCEHFEVVFRA